MVTGGVEPTEKSLSLWFDAGVSCVGIGSSLFPKETLDKGEWTIVSELCRDCLLFVQRNIGK